MMKRTILIFIFFFFSVCSYAQSGDFNKVLEACRLAQSSMSYGEGSQSEIIEASEMLTSAKWNPLILQDIDVRHEAPIKNHMVFSPDFLWAVAKDRSVYRRAKAYLDEYMSSQRRGGGDVLLCTKCIKAQNMAVYAIRHTGGSFNIAAVAEVNGLINLSVVVRDENGDESRPYKISSDEFKGAPMRKLGPVMIPRGNSMVFITIENRSDKDKSVAIIVE